MAVLTRPLPRTPIRSTRVRALSGFVFVALGSISASAGAATIYSDLGAGDSYDSSHGLVVGKQPFDLAWAAEFVNGAGADVNLQQVDLGMGYISGGNGAVVSLWSEHLDAPGSELAQWSITLPTGSGTAPSLVSISGIDNVALGSGATYFLQVQPATADSILSWNLNDVGATTKLFSPTASGGTQLEISDAPAFRLSGTPIPTPLPAGVGLLLVGLLPLAWAARKIP